MKSTNVNHPDKITIQVVEDSPTQSESLKYLLEEHGFHVRVACSGEEGLEQINLQKTNLILSDIVMPGMDGYELCRAIKTNDELKTIPVILLTKLSDPSDIIRGLEVMSDDYLIKPYDDDTLLSKLEKWLNPPTSLGIQAKGDCLNVTLGGTGYSIHSSRQQLLDVLLSTYENAVHQNRELLKTKSELSALNREYVAKIRELQVSEDRLETRVRERTAELVEVNKTLRTEISIRAQMEERQNVLSRILAILNQPSQKTMAIEQILFLIKEHLGIEAVGIRLREEEDFSYYATSGFSENFIEAENYLCALDSDGEMIRDSQGNPYLECMCGNILCGRTNPSLPFFTKKGSFWTNNTTELLASTSEKDRLARTRNRCNSEGYESVALIPLRSGEEIIGLLQLNDRRTNRFTSNSIEFLEEIGSSIGIALLRKKREEEIRKNETLYRTLINSLTQCIFLKNDRYEYVSANRSYSNLIGMNIDDFLGKTDYDIFPKEFADKYRDDDRKIIDAGKTLALTEEIIVGDTKRWIETVKTPITNTDGKVTSVLGIFWDITERRNLEEQLRQSQKMEAIGQLAGGIAHDFNNLIMVIKGNCSFASQGLNPEDARFQDIEEIKHAAERASTLTRQLLAFSRRQVLQPVVLSINDLLFNMDKMLHRLIGEDIDLVTIPKHPLDFVKADPGQIEQIIMNLAVNARDAMPQGGALTIETANVTFDKNYIHRHPETHMGSFVMLAVSDTGCGMDEKTKERIFEPFFTTKEKGKGTGLGLATIYGIVKQSEGFIYVYSELGKGTAFKVYLPRVEESNEEIHKEILSEGSLNGTETVLLVEDDEGVRQSIKRMLQQYNYTLVIAANGKEAIEDYEKYNGKIDLLLTDVVMPGMSGRELASHLVSVNPMLKVLYMSGFTDNIIIHHGMLDKGIHLIQKPFDQENLVKTIRNLLDKAEAL